MLNSPVYSKPRVHEAMERAKPGGHCGFGSDLVWLSLSTQKPFRVARLPATAHGCRIPVRDSITRGFQTHS